MVLGSGGTWSKSLGMTGSRVYFLQLRPRLSQTVQQNLLHLPSCLIKEEGTHSEYLAPLICQQFLPKVIQVQAFVCFVFFLLFYRHAILMDARG